VRKVNSPEATLRFVRESLGLEKSAPVEVAALSGRGSDRAFYRVRWGGKGSAILIRYDPKRIENSYYADIALFLMEAGIPVPRVMGHDAMRCLILIEDLGEQDLWSLRNAPWEVRREAYHRTLCAIARLHSFPETTFPTERVTLMEPFGPSLYRWEREYFFTHFVRDCCRISLDPEQLSGFEGELSSLAMRLDDSRRCLIHRDLQSQNVMVCDGSPFFIDFQGMRFGSPFYDLGSLLCDPYIQFSDDERDELLSFYYKVFKSGLDRSSYETLFWEASAQRLMQALGAYGFLGLKKGLKSFLNHIPMGLRNLRNAAEQAGSLPRLNDLSRLCAEALLAYRGELLCPERTDR
jgi:N-acetylmuramate 1-kinase